uniref:Plastid lipid-associated protein/fibrillin conserved domain-containing protein n=1 Tax=Chaetoceros debilis TaxID=122233 RepID=A0A7S3V5R6_9STRA
MKNLCQIFALFSFLAKHEMLSLGLEMPRNSISRREVFVKGAGVTTAAVATAFLPQQNAFANNNFIDESSEVTSSPERNALLQKIVSKASDDEVELAIKNLERLDPSKGNAASVDELGGRWELIYSVNAEAFSPLLNLPEPIRPRSLQLIGEDAASVVGDGRIAQVLNFPIIPLTFLLSSGAVPLADPDLSNKDTSNLEIFPPFRFEIQLGSARVQVVEAGSDAEFRALNARDEDAQKAGRNIYKQRYLDMTGKKGDLRISEVTSGDPVIVGEVFVHRRL